jgi:hypothetical protein
MENQIKTQIKTQIEKLNTTKYKYIYGGITEKYLKTRLSQHKEKKEPPQCNEKFKIKKICEIRNINDENIKLVSNLENYLINELDKKFQKKCINTRTKTGTSKQTGGLGNKLNKNDTCRFYIMYEKNTEQFVPF